MAAFYFYMTSHCNISICRTLGLSFAAAPEAAACLADIRNTSRSIRAASYPPVFPKLRNPDGAFETWVRPRETATLIDAPARNATLGRRFQNPRRCRIKRKPPEGGSPKPKIVAA